MTDPSSFWETEPGRGISKGDEHIWESNEISWRIESLNFGFVKAMAIDAETVKIRICLEFSKLLEVFTNDSEIT